jgi:threonine aldolase
MAAAEVGDDVYREDPTVLELESRTAELLGKEAAVYVPSGTMSNQVALRTHTEPGDLAVMDGGSHMIINEGGGAAAWSGVTVWRVPGGAGVFSGDDVRAAIEVPHPFNPPHHSPHPRLVCVEQTHNQSGGVLWSLDQLHEVATVAREHGMATHMDGARLWHASAASGIPERDYAEAFDTVSVCFSKGLGAPVGSALVGTRELVGRARRFKQMLGGGFRQAGIVAAGALYALDHHRHRLSEDVRRAKELAVAISDVEGLAVNLPSVQSNIVRFEVRAMSAGAFVDRCYERGVHMLPGGAVGVRAVLHFGIDDDDVAGAAAVIGEVLGIRPPRPRVRGRGGAAPGG